MSDIDLAAGRAVPLSKSAEEMKKAREEESRRKSIRLIQKVRCPVHQQSAKNVRMQMYGGKVKWTYDKCCAELDRAVEAVLRKER